MSVYSGVTGRRKVWGLLCCASGWGQRAFCRATRWSGNTRKYTHGRICARRSLLYFCKVLL